MKHVSLFIVFCMVTMAMMAQTKNKNCVEILYFHGKQRCATCMAIEKNTREVVEKNFAEAKKKGRVVFRSVDISTDEGAKTAKEYRVTWSSLYLNRWRDGKETRNDLTPFAFKTARNKTEEFKKGVSDKVNELLK